MVSGGPENEKSRGSTGVNLEMAGPITMKLSEIDWGVRAHIFSQRIRGTVFIRGFEEKK